MRQVSYLPYMLLTIALLFGHEMVSAQFRVTQDVAADASIASAVPEVLAEDTIQVAASVAADTVTLTWSAAPGISIYGVSASTVPGGAAIAQSTVNTTQLVAQSVPAGTYYVRVTGMNAAGAVVATSAETMVSVQGSTCASQLAAPVQLAATVVGGTVALSWSHATPGCVQDYVMRVGTAPDRIDVGQFSVGTATSFTTTDVPPGVYYVAVHARNSAGLSPPSPVVSVQVGSTCVTPPAPTSVSAAVDGSVVRLSWDSGGTGVASTYIVEAGSVAGAADLAVTTVSAPALTASVPSGRYYVRIRTVDACGPGPASPDTLVIVGNAEAQLAEALAARVYAARTRAELTTTIAEVMRALNIGVYTAGGAPLLSGAERGPQDLYAYDFELRGLAASIEERDFTTLDALAIVLTEIELTPDDGELDSALLQTALRSAIESPTGSGGRGAFLVRALGMRRPNPQDILAVEPSAVRLDALQRYILLADLRVALDKLVPPDARAGFKDVLGTVCVFLGNSGFWWMGDVGGQLLEKGQRPGGRPARFTRAAGRAGLIISVLAKVLHGSALANLISVRVAVDGHKPTGHYGHPFENPELRDDRVVLRVHVEMREDLPPDVVACGELADLKFPKKGGIEGIPIDWNLGFNLNPGYQKLRRHGTVIQEDPKTDATGTASLVVDLREEVMVAIGPVTEDKGRLDVEAKILSTFGNLLGTVVEAKDGGRILPVEFVVSYHQRLEGTVTYTEVGKTPTADWNVTATLTIQPDRPFGEAVVSADTQGEVNACPSGGYLASSFNHDTPPTETPFIVHRVPVSTPDGSVPFRLQFKYPGFYTDVFYRWSIDNCASFGSGSQREWIDDWTELRTIEAVWIPGSDWIEDSRVHTVPGFSSRLRWSLRFSDYE